MTLEDMLMRDESRRLKVYDDATGKTLRPKTFLVGNPTIGIGRNLIGQGITDEEADYFLHNDIARIRQELALALPWYLSLSLPRQLVIESLCFNMGMDGLLRCRPTLDVIQAGHYAYAADRMMKWKWYGQTKGRAKRLVAMMRDNRIDSL